MKVSSGVTHALTEPHAQHELAASQVFETSPRSAARPRVGRLTLLAWAASAVLLGCSSPPSTTWRVEPTYRVEGGATSTAQGYLALARQYEGEQRAAQALDAYRKAAEAAPDDADVQNAYGLALARQASFGPAIAALRRAVALAPERASLLNNLGYALLLDGRAEEARAMFRLTLAVDPAHAVASSNLAHIERQQAATARIATPPAAAAVDVAALEPVAPTAAVPAEAAAPVAAGRVVPAAAPVQTASASTAATRTTDKASVSGLTHLDGVSIEIVNGNGITGAAARLRLWLGEKGIKAGRLANLLPYSSPRTRVLYRPGKGDAAREVAQRLPVQADVAPAPAGSTRADLRVLLGHDVRRSAGCAALAACAAPEPVASSADWQGHAAAVGGNSAERGTH